MPDENNLVNGKVTEAPDKRFGEGAVPSARTSFNLYNRESMDEYMKRPLSERLQHLDENAPCIEISTQGHLMRGILSMFLSTGVPSGHKVCLCHYCGNGKCSNPYHLYWGTASENEHDKKRHGTFKTPLEWCELKHGKEKAREILRASGRRSGLKLKGKPKSEEHKQNLSKAMKALKK